MVNVNYEISKDEYDKAKNSPRGAYEIISDGIKMGYGAYCAEVYEVDGHYYLRYDRGNSCD